MAKYVIEESSLTGIADEIRTMSGSTEKITPSEMVTNLQTLNAEIENQAELISQIQTALENKMTTEESPEVGIFCVYSKLEGLRTVCAFEIGMTWSDFLDSSYNKTFRIVGGSNDEVSFLSPVFKLYSGYIARVDYAFYEVSTDGTSANRVKPTDLIQNEAIYSYYYDD